LEESIGVDRPMAAAAALGDAMELDREETVSLLEADTLDRGD